MSEIEPQILLARLQPLVDARPEFNGAVRQAKAFEWAGKVRAVAGRSNQVVGEEMDAALDNLCGSVEYIAEKGWRQLTMLAARSAAELEIAVASNDSAGAQVFGPGAMYDVHKALKNILRDAASSVMIVDPYMNGDIFDGYVSELKKGATCSLLISKKAKGVAVSAKTYVAQHSAKVEVRSSESMHDRVIVVDDTICWVMGQSIKDAAASKPTYIAPLDAEVSALKIQHYLDIWNSAQIVFPAP